MGISRATFSAQMTINNPTLALVQQIATDYETLLKNYNNVLHHAPTLRDEFLQQATHRHITPDQTHFYPWHSLPGDLRTQANELNFSGVESHQLNGMAAVYDATNRRAHLFTEREAVWMKQILKLYATRFKPELAGTERTHHFNQYLSDIVGKSPKGNFGEYKNKTPNTFALNRPPEILVDQIRTLGTILINRASSILAGLF